MKEARYLFPNVREVSAPEKESQMMGSLWQKVEKIKIRNFTVAEKEKKGNVRFFYF